MKTFLLLIALGYGYKIFVDATKEQGGLKTLGRLIGIVMMVIAAGIGACKAVKCASAMYCPTKTCGGPVCPMMR